MEQTASTAAEARSSPAPTVPGDSEAISQKKRQSVRALEWTNFFLADVQAGVGPFVAAYLASLGWQAGAVGRALTFGGIVTVVLQTPAGGFVDHTTRKRAILIGGSLLLAVGALLLAASGHTASVYTAEGLIGLAGPFLAPTVAAITMGLVGKSMFDCQFGRNQGFNAAGNLFAAATIAATSHFLGNRAIFLAVAVLVVPTVVAALRIRPGDIDQALARGGSGAPAQPGESPDKAPAGQTAQPAAGFAQLFGDRVLVAFLACAFLFHFSNAAMLPQLGEMLAHGNARAAAPFMSACVAITQLVMLSTAAFIGRFASTHGRKGLLLLGFGVLPIRAVLYTVFHAVPALLAVQVLDGVANSIFGVVSVLVVADRTRGTGRFNLAGGALATAVGLGAALSNAFGGTLMETAGFRVSFLALGGAACLAFLLLLLGVPETAGDPEPHAGNAAPQPAQG